MRYVWAIATKKDSLWVRWINSRFLSRNSIWTLPIPASCSWCLRSILQVVNAAQQCTKYFIGNGRNTLLWLDPWHPRGILISTLGDRIARPNRMATVASIRHGNSWNTGRPTSTTLAAVWDMLPHIDTIHQASDRIAWTPSTSGVYTLKSAYYHLYPTGSIHPLSHLAWFKGAVPRFSFITWLQIRGRLPTLDRLHQWGVVQSSTCVLCAQHPESAHHLFFECQYSAEVWANLLRRSLLAHTPAGWDSEQSWLSTTLKGDSLTSTIRKIALTATIYHIWAERNNRVHNANAKPAKITISSICIAVQCRLTYLFSQVQTCAINQQILDSWGIRGRGMDISPIWTRWLKPSPGCITICTDASIRGTVAGLGCILRDYLGAPLAAMGFGVPASDSILLHEMQAIYKGLNLALQNHQLHAQLQSDSKTAVDIILGRAQAPWKCWTTLSRIEAIKCRFSQISFAFVYREANQPADFLSHLCLTIGEKALTPVEYPHELAKLIDRDRNQVLYQRR